jgi:hypothetical protein
VLHMLLRGSVYCYCSDYITRLILACAACYVARTAGSADNGNELRWHRYATRATCLHTSFVHDNPLNTCQMYTVCAQSSLLSHTYRDSYAIT